MTETKHTPPPWHLHQTAFATIIGGHNIVAELDVQADAEIIVRAVNSHAELLALVQTASNLIADLTDCLPVEDHEYDKFLRHATNTIEAAK